MYNNLRYGKDETYDYSLTVSVASFGQTPEMMHRPFTILITAKDGNRIKNTPTIHGKTTPAEVIQLR